MPVFDNKVALVSASSSGIGRAISKVLAEDGCRLHIFSRSEERVSAVAREIEHTTGRSVNYSHGDMTSIPDMQRVVSEVHSVTGNVSFLVINYGDPKIAPFLEISGSDWDYAINMFLRTSVHLVRSFLPWMLENGGRIIFVTSLTTKQPMKGFSLSASLRSAVVSLSKVLSLEYSSHNVTFNSISQGFFETPRLKGVAERNAAAGKVSIDEAYRRMMDDIPAGRFGNPEEIGHLVSFLCSDSASYINGTNIQIDGGFTRFPF